jgi:hypothetical protein
MPRLVALVAFVFCFVAGYFVADLWSRRDTSPLAKICARVDYVNGLRENLKGQQAASEEVRAEFKALVEQCRAALRDRAEENDLPGGDRRARERDDLLARFIQSPAHHFSALLTFLQTRIRFLNSSNHAQTIALVRRS